ncbi:sulfotransferase domain-containing protein [Thalassotalea mangrovi]|uniref:Sulfotransferase domain-containing protein n=1 Tax=Thalassotalea mangrovi TaxID=2572245 RepID=A0A4U1B232_9GAMM|nr:sulfotransferase domain-containing protein [Thalassotalea mangrovi]TKB43528.1 sulfotransferase domain-containing protein [Thalassotalea mangrovi]
MKTSIQPLGRIEQLFNRKQQQIKFQYRLLTAKQRALPSFIVLGARHSGTAALVKYLRQHPQLHHTFQSQTHYFDGGLAKNQDNFDNGESWYRAHFPLRKELAPGQQCFESSTFYSFHPLAAERIKELLPGVKIIFILRNPIDRAICHYTDEKNARREYLPLIKALQMEEQRLSWSLTTQDYRSDAFLHATYKSRGHYKEQIERFLRYFDRQHIKIISIEEFNKSPLKILEQLYQFIGISNFHNKSVTPLQRNQLIHETEVRRYLNHYFSERNQSLYEFCGKSFHW